ncbi:MAG TPA: type I DNA topoisomerase [Candidatus Methylomirabilis sp.]|nr:type I DNA topoisomerase [Candidatus Methylomirabilis sp.]
MAKSLVIVESPAKAKTISKLLGKGYVVKASYGHVRDLPTNRLAVDVKRNFTPQYQVVKGREKVVDDLRKAAKGSHAIYLATDPDREGEAIGWHLVQELKPPKKAVHRVVFHEVTKRAVQDAFAHPGALDLKKVEAQQARRILDRLVGYQVSPLLWEKVKRGLSAGRVQSVALRLIVDREREIRAFVPQEHWTIEALLAAGVPPEFRARLFRVNGDKVEVHTEAEASTLVEELRHQRFVVRAISTRERRRHPVPPFTTSKLQQEAVRKLGMTARRAMALAQQLYEGIELGEEGAVGLITYMRTDSTRVAAEAVEEARRYIAERFGGQFVPERPPVYKSAKAAQEAHEAVRPTSVLRDPAAVARFLTKDQLNLYTLIWNRFVASQMPPALFDVTTVEVEAGRLLLRASGRVTRFEGFTRLYVEGTDEGVKGRAEEGQEPEDHGEPEAEMTLPPLAEGEVLQLRTLDPQQHFTHAPPRFTEATLVKELEECGIGRPSTYAPILQVIQNRDYVVKEKGKFRPTEMGEVVVDLLVKSFPRIMDTEFTARMESVLDEIEEGRADWLGEMRRFYGEFSQWLEQAKTGMENLKALEEKTEATCEKCDSPMVIRWGRFGKFLACSAYPECKNTHELPAVRSAELTGHGEEVKGPAATGEPSTVSDTKVCDQCGRPMVLKRGRYGLFWACSGYPDCRNVLRPEGTGRPAPEPTDEKCASCGAPMVIRHGRYGRFLACSTYPKCRTVRPIPLDVKCPRCGGALVQRRSKRGRSFYGCSNYPECTFVLWQRPITEPCPQCGATFLVQHQTRQASELRCATEGCNYRKPAA